MSIDRDTVGKVAFLARLAISEQELDRVTPELSKILEYFEKLRELDLAGVPPTSHVQVAQGGLREDEPIPSLANEIALKNAPDGRPPFYCVPRVIEREES